MDFTQEQSGNDYLFDPYNDVQNIVLQTTHNISSTEKKCTLSEEEKQINRKALNEAFERVQDHD